jgi:hypothetical protein
LLVGNKITGYEILKCSLRLSARHLFHLSTYPVTKALGMVRRGHGGPFFLNQMAPLMRFMYHTKSVYFTDTAPALRRIPAQNIARHLYLNADLRNVCSSTWLYR